MRLDVSPPYQAALGVGQATFRPRKRGASFLRMSPPTSAEGIENTSRPAWLRTRLYAKNVMHAYTLRK